MLTFGSLFSGCGGFDLGLARAGMKGVWASEIDENPRRVFASRFPNIELFGDIRELSAKQLEPVDLICGGFPCQDLSVAGQRKGLAGERSGLFYEFMRIAGELAPSWILIENVPGLLSSNGGRDMGAVIGTLGQLGYGVVYRVLDSKHFGVPQSRRRVYIVGHLGGFCAPEILFEPESCERDTSTSRQAKPETAKTLTCSANSSRRDDAAESTYIAATITAGCNGNGRRQEDDFNLVARPITTKAGWADRDFSESNYVVDRSPEIANTITTPRGSDAGEQTYVVCPETHANGM